MAAPSEKPETERPDPVLELIQLGSQAAYFAHRRAAAAGLARRRERERELLAAGGGREIPGRCWSCDRRAGLLMAPAMGAERGPRPVWREELICPRCLMSTRQRAALHLVHELLTPSAEDAIYITEQESAIFTWFAANYPEVTGSEYLGEAVELGLCDARGYRNEDLERLTLSPESQDLVLSFDVLEHVADTGRALAECARVLRPGGALVFTVPFDTRARRSRRRADRDAADGGVRHLLEPEIHFDPQGSGGSLAYHSFGWDLLDRVRASGFAEAHAVLYWSEDFGYLGDDLILFVATKPPAGEAAAGVTGGGEEERLRTGYEGLVARLRAQVERLAAPPPAGTGAREAGHSTEAAEAERRLAFKTAQLARAYDAQAELSRRLYAEGGRSRSQVLRAAEAERRRQDLAEEAAELGRQLAAMAAERDRLEAERERLGGELAAGAAVRSALQADLAAAAATRAGLGSQLTALDDELTASRSRLRETADRLAAEAAARCSAEERLTARQAELAAIHRSKMWRLWTAYHAVRRLALSPFRALASALRRRPR